MTLVGNRAVGNIRVGENRLDQSVGVVLRDERDAELRQDAAGRCRDDRDPGRECREQAARLLFYQTGLHYDAGLAEPGEIVARDMAHWEAGPESFAFEIAAQQHDFEIELEGQSPHF